MGRSGNNTRPAQQLVNLKISMKNLEGLLAANFGDGAQLLTLAYGEGVLAPSRKLAEIQIRDWMRTAREKRGQRVRYIRATEWKEAGRGNTIHRVVMGLSKASAASLAGLWEYGPVKVETVQGEDMEALAAFLMRPALEAQRNPVPCGHIWAPSHGLIRPEQKGEKRHELSEPHGG